jgi:hypothetical protein
MWDSQSARHFITSTLVAWRKNIICEAITISHKAAYNYHQYRCHRYRDNKTKPETRWESTVCLLNRWSRLWSISNRIGLGRVRIACCYISNESILRGNTLAAFWMGANSHHALCQLQTSGAAACTDSVWNISDQSNIAATFWHYRHRCQVPRFGAIDMLREQHKNISCLLVAVEAALLSKPT